MVGFSEGGCWAISPGRDDVSRLLVLPFAYMSHQSQGESGFRSQGAEGCRAGLDAMFDWDKCFLRGKLYNHPLCLTLNDVVPYFMCDMIIMRLFMWYSLSVMNYCSSA